MRGEHLGRPSISDAVRVRGPFTQVSQIIPHKEYDADKAQANDIALVELQDEVEVTAWTQPVCVDWERRQPPLREGEEGVVGGGGCWVKQKHQAPTQHGGRL